MAKVKRKQIEYEGTNKQVIKGNGELGDYDDKVIVELTTIESQIKNISNEELSCNKSSEELLTILTAGKLIDWRLKTTATNVEYYTLLQAVCVNSAARYNFYKDITLYLYDFNNNGHLYITVEIKKRRANDDIVFICIGNYINNITRTHNHETLYPLSAGDANLHDGFYFPNATQDADGNWYGAVVIGDQVWLGENLRTTKYTDGTSISQETEAVDTPAYFDKTTSTIPLKERGLFYNWYAVMNGEEETDEHPIVQGVAPTGWHIPNINEYAQLHDYIANQERYNHFVASFQTPDCNLKVISSTDHWTPRTYKIGDSPVGPGIDSNLNNSTGFNAKPCNINADGTNIHFWTSTKGSESDRAVFVFGEDRTNHFFTEVAYSTLYNTYFTVRCVSDLNPVQFRNWYIQQYGSLQHHLPEEVQVQSDWNQTNANAPDFIKNKPIIVDDTYNAIIVCNRDLYVAARDSSPGFVFEFTAEDLFNAYKAQKKVKYYIKTLVSDSNVEEQVYAYRELENTFSLESGIDIGDTYLYSYIQLRAFDFASQSNNQTASYYYIILEASYDPDSDLNEISTSCNYYSPQPDWNQSNPTALDYIKNKPNSFFYGYTNTAESTPKKVVTLAEPTTGFKNGTYITIYFAGGGVPAGNDNAISIDNDVYYLAYKAQGITQAGVINKGDKVLLWCHNGFAHVISNDRWSLPTVTAADEGKILKVVNGALVLVNP